MADGRPVEDVQVDHCRNLKLGRVRYRDWGKRTRDERLSGGVTLVPHYIYICPGLLYIKAVVYSGSNGQLKPISSKLQNSAEWAFEAIAALLSFVLLNPVSSCHVSTSWRTYWRSKGGARSMYHLTGGEVHWKRPGSVVPMLCQGNLADPFFASTNVSNLVLSILTASFISDHQNQLLLEILDAIWFHYHVLNC